MRDRKWKGFGRKRWSRQWLYENLKLFNSYRVRRPPTKVALVVSFQEVFDPDRKL
jgi:RNA-directed DNA polymerase